ncbi:hypothetical protein HHK36_029391 [Tetracentron sinense]|uniref:SAM domain-containing protein n=1 Tax=Tetracentron sinense TaxID=13715 RepID=A0A835CZK9_TETSI|nr:hypothetical protein HHK36_029391 [Tetracentron sinense]
MAELQPPAPEGPISGGAMVVSENLGQGLASKRQRRPSVRLGDIGDQPATISCDSYLRRSKQWKPPAAENDFKFRHPSQKDTTASGKASRTRPLTNLGNGGDCHETLETEDKNLSGDGNLDSIAFGIRKGKDLKAKRGGVTKRVRSNWVSKVDEGGEVNEKFSGGEDGYRDFDPEGSESPLKEQSPTHSMENGTPDFRQTSDKGLGNEREGNFPGQRRPARVRVSESRDHDAIELDGPPSDTDARDWKCGTSVDRNRVSDRGRCWSLEDGLRMWLNGLGLGRYAPVFEIHEVDEDILPLLTLEDLKDMGINAVGSRRKMNPSVSATLVTTTVFLPGSIPHLLQQPPPLVPHDPNSYASPTFSPVWPSSPSINDSPTCLTDSPIGATHVLPPTDSFTAPQIKFVVDLNKKLATTTGLSDTAPPHMDLQLSHPPTAPQLMVGSHPMITRSKTGKLLLIQLRGFEPRRTIRFEDEASFPLNQSFEHIRLKLRQKKCHSHSSRGYFKHMGLIVDTIMGMRYKGSLRASVLWL